jgi:cytochrome P450
VAKNECRTYLDEMIEEQRSTKVTEKNHNNLIGALVRASRQAEEEKDRGYGSGGLTKDEIRGNLYIFTFAGHETTANAMAYAISLLAAYPKWLDWVIEEIDTVLDRHDRADYDEVFPRLKRCQALMVRSPMVGIVVNMWTEGAPLPFHSPHCSSSEVLHS